jgi:hypothetical protein
MFLQEKTYSKNPNEENTEQRKFNTLIIGKGL